MTVVTKIWNGMEWNGMVPPTKIRNARNGTGSLGNACTFIVWKKFVTTFVLFKSWKQYRNDGRESSDCEASTNNYGCDWASWKYDKAADTLVQSYRSLSWEMVKNGSEHCHHHAYIWERETERDRESRDCSVPCILYFSRWNLSIPFRSVPFQILVTTFMTLLARQGYNLPALPSLYCLLSRWAVLVFPDTHRLHTRAGGRVCRSQTETRVVLAIKCG